VPKSQMLINYVPGDECRVAIVRDGRLEEFFAERMNSASAVGNIAVGRVTNVESSIQAAFVDFGHEQNGFLHITDLHPRYFSKDDDGATERVGKKTPHRERPPIQKALKRGQEVVVQVIKEGIGTKGPTLSTYLSIPGRFLVMMPEMDKVGVSRKVEDDDERRDMRKILDTLDLPEGFGFILRTAGMGRTKADLKRDLAYLQRLWRDMEVRRKKGKAPRLLYAESDLLVRTLRDVLTSEIDEVVIDHPSALKRAANFMKIVSPRAAAKLLHFDREAPIFHAYGVEEQIELMHSREVPLKSGGRLVIDETEALVAIDVNSGKSRSAGDAETNALRTNLEAADEICRQLKLRDLGGLVVLDLIDMRHRSNRAKVETAFKDCFKRDRARTKVLGISQLGLIELTRQRMRGSVLNTQYADCPTCVGFGRVQRPSFVAADGMRELAALLEHDRVHKVEMVVSPRVASEYLTSKRRALGRLEHRVGKIVEVRVSETIPVDKVTYYAYDERGSDIAIDKLPTPKPPTDLEPWAKSAASGGDWAVDPSEETSRLEEAEAELFEEEEELIGDLISQDISSEDEGEESGDESGDGKRKRRRRGGRGRRRSGPDGDDSSADAKPEPKEPVRELKREEKAAPESGSGGDDEDDGGKRRRRRRRGGRGRGGRSRDGEDREESKSDAPKPERAKAAREPRDRDSSARESGRESSRASGGGSSRRSGGSKEPSGSDGGAAKEVGSGPGSGSGSSASDGGSGGVIRRAWGFGVAASPKTEPASSAGSGSASKASDGVGGAAPAKRSTKKTSKKTASRVGTKKTTSKKATSSAKKTTKKSSSKKTATRKKSSKKASSKKTSRKTSGRGAGEAEGS